jgi:hypothetical protein
MRAYFVISGIIFALVAILHVWRIIAEWHGIDAPFLIVAATGALALVLAVWAGTLLAATRRT